MGADYHDSDEELEDEFKGQQENSEEEQDE